MQMIVRLFLVLIALVAFATAGVFVLSLFVRIFMPH
jgi:hypothetical protein